uniref:4_1_CTD domain-containing protein n=1 Tax=Angiostrongylus cantonensis TaxID=6313 RepID=A0A158P7W8_ANGCA
LSVSTANKPSEEVTARQIRLIARVPHNRSADNSVSTKLKGKRSEDSSGLFRLWKPGSRMFDKDSVGLSAYPSSDKYVGPLDDISCQKDIDKIPFDVPAPAVYEPTAEHHGSDHHRVHLVTRWRHGGDEEVVEKDHVRPEAYGIASTSYDGPFELTTRESDLLSTPLEEHAQVYHHGQSCVSIKRSKAAGNWLAYFARGIRSLEASRESVEKIRLIAHVPHETSEESFGSAKLKVWSSQDSTRDLDFPKLHTQKDHRDPLALSAHPNSDECVRPLGQLNPTNDIEHLPCKCFLSDVVFDGLRRNSDIENTSRLPFPEKGSYDRFISEQHCLTSDSGNQGRNLHGRILDGDDWIEVRLHRHVEVPLESTFALAEPGLRAVSEDCEDLVFTVTPPLAPSKRSFFGRFGFKSSAKKAKKQKKGAKETDSSDSSSSSGDEKNQVHVMPVESGGVTLPRYFGPGEKDGRVVRQETNELKYHLKGEGVSPRVDPQNPSLASTIAEAERLNLRCPRLEHAERTVTVRALAPLPLSYEGIVNVERTHEETTPLGLTVTAMNGSVAESPHVVETHTRSVAYDADPNGKHHEDLGEFVSCKTLTSGNRTVETYTYKTERDGIIETHVEHRVTILSDEPIDHDAELSQAIMEATQMNPDMTVEKIEVRQETTA